MTLRPKPPGWPGDPELLEDLLEAAKGMRNAFADEQLGSELRQFAASFTALSSGSRRNRAYLIGRFLGGCVTAGYLPPLGVIVEHATPE